MSAFSGPSIVLLLAVALGRMSTVDSDGTHYTKLDARSLERHVCNGAEPSASNDILGFVRVKADAGRVVHITVTSDGTFEPALIIDADDGLAAELGWFRDIGGTRGVVDTRVVLPAAGSYMLAITDRRLELPRVVQPTCADVRITTERLPQTLPMPPSWYGTVSAPVAFDISRVDPRSQTVSVENFAEHGVLAASVFEDGEFQDMAMIAPLESRQFAVSPYAVAARLIVERAIAPTGETIDVFVTTASYEQAPERTPVPVGHGVAHGLDAGDAPSVVMKSF